MKPCKESSKCINVVSKDLNEFVYNRVWSTKKSRMEAEARMNRNNVLIQVIINYYTFWLLTYSIITIVSKLDLNLLTVVASVAVFGFSIFMNSFNYREKSLEFRKSYLELSDLESQAKNLLRKIDLEQISLDKASDEVEKIQKSYSKILSVSENHKTLDFIKISKNNTFKDQLKLYIFEYVIKSMLLLIIFFLPIGLLLINLLS